MQYLVQMKIVPQARPMSSEAGVASFEEYIRQERSLLEDLSAAPLGLPSWCEQSLRRNWTISSLICRCGREWKPKLRPSRLLSIAGFRSSGDRR
jgi:hypothetical protein